jgi:hypothetical protein
MNGLARPEIVSKLTIDPSRAASSDLDGRPGIERAMKGEP